MNERTVQLRDGERFAVRAMEPDDAEVVLAGFQSLSPASLRSRFFSPVPRIAPDVAADLVRVDHANRVVLLAFDEHDHLAGGVRALRDAADPTRAEVAVTVGDAYQRRGLGSRLLRAAASVAREEGVQELTGFVLVDNAAARALLIRNGAMCRLYEPGVLSFTIPLDRRIARRHSPVPAPVVLAS